MPAPRSEPRFLPEDLAEVVVPTSPCVLGDRIVYVLRRIDAAEKKTRSSLHVVPLVGGPTRALTRGAWSDRAPAADPRGRFVVFLSDRGAGDQLHRLEADGGESRPLTALPRGRIGDVAMSPDGSHVALVLTPEPPDDDALPLAAELVARAPVDGLLDEYPGADARVLDRPPVSRPTARARVYSRMRNREDGLGWFGHGHANVWIVDTATGAARRLTRGGRDHSGPCWSPDGAAIVVAATREPPEVADLDATRNELLRVRVSDGAVDTLRKPEGAAFAPSFSPRGDAVAYVLSPPDDDMGFGTARAWLTPLAGGEPRPLTASLDRTLFDFVIDDLVGALGLPVAPMWSADGTRVQLVASDHGAVRVWDQPIDGGEGRWRTAGDVALGPLTHVRGELATVVCARDRFPEIGVVATDGSLRVLTTHNAELTARTAPRLPERVRIVRDGVTIEGFYLAPRKLAPGARAPAILYVHGGPHACYGERLFFEMQWLADEGYAVMYTNPRGSQSYGEAYSRAIHFHWGDPDAGDQLAFVDWLCARPDVDRERIAVAGGSYGGFMGLLLAATTDRFRTVIAERGLYNWASHMGASDFGHQAARYFGHKHPWQDPEPWLAASPIRLVEHVRAPTLVIHYEGDLRVGTEQGIQLFDALRLQGVPSALLIFPDEDHGMTRGGRIDRRIERFRQLRAWLETWLRG